MELKDLYRNRFPESALAEKNALWRVICSVFLSRYVRPSDSVVDIGAGYCEFINNIEAREKTAVDLNPDVARFANPGTRIINESCTSISTLATSSVDIVFM